MEELTLILTENELDFKTFKLCNLTGSQIVSFDVEIDKETALISYETQEKFRNKGYASKGLNLLKDVLFNEYFDEWFESERIKNEEKEIE